MWVGGWVGRGWPGPQTPPPPGFLSKSLSSCHSKAQCTSHGVSQAWHTCFRRQGRGPWTAVVFGAGPPALCSRCVATAL